MWFGSLRALGVKSWRLDTQQLQDISTENSKFKIIKKFYEAKPAIPLRCLRKWRTIFGIKSALRITLLHQKEKKKRFSEHVKMMEPVNDTAQSLETYFMICRKPGKRPSDIWTKMRLGRLKSFISCQTLARQSMASPVCLEPFGFSRLLCSGCGKPTLVTNSTVLYCALEKRAPDNKPCWSSIP